MFFFKQKTAYEMRISDWSSDVCSSDLRRHRRVARVLAHAGQPSCGSPCAARLHRRAARRLAGREGAAMTVPTTTASTDVPQRPRSRLRARIVLAGLSACGFAALAWASFVSPLPRLTYNPSASVAVGWYRIDRSEEHTSELQSLMRTSSAVLCCKK